MTLTTSTRTMTPTTFIDFITSNPQIYNTITGSSTMVTSSGSITYRTFGRCCWIVIFIIIYRCNIITRHNCRKRQYIIR